MCHRHDTKWHVGPQVTQALSQYHSLGGSNKFTVFKVWGKNTILKFVGNTKQKSMKLTLQLVVVVLIAPTKFRDNLFKFTLYTIIIYKVGDTRC